MRADPGGRAPPRPAERVLGAVLAPGLAREGLLGDLHEEYAARCAEMSVIRARLWYWRQVVSISPRMAWRRLAPGGQPARSRRGDSGMSTLLHELRCAVRSLHRHPGVTLVAVPALALGIGANVLIFGFADAFLLRPLPFADADRLVHVWGTDALRGESRLRVSLPTYLEWREANAAFDDLALFNYTTADITDGEHAEKVQLGRVTANAFRLLGVEPRLGRGFVDGEDRPGSTDVAVISDRLWQRRYAARPDVLGTTLRLSDREHTIIGVMPPHFAFPLNTTELWTPYALDPATYDAANRVFQVVGRLAPGVSRAQAEALLEGRRLLREHERPESERGRGAAIVPLREALNFAYDVLAPMALVLATVGVLVLLLACANVASILLARGTARRREIAVRMALGAARTRISSQLLTESLLLAALGGAAGVGLALLGLGALDRLIPPDIYRAGALGLNPAVLACTVGLCVLAALVFGLAPALRAARAPADGLRQAARGASAGAGARRAQGALVVAQIALTLALLVGAGLMTRSLGAMRSADPGFAADGVFTAVLTLQGERYRAPAAVRAFHDELLAAAAREPGVAGAALVDYLPLNHETYYEEVAAVAGPAAADGQPRAAVLSVTPGYFDVLRLPVLQGRGFTDADAPEAAAVAVVNAALQRRLWPDGDAVGRALVLGDDRGARTEVTVVGVVADARHAALHGPPEPQLYLPQAQHPRRYFRILLRAADPGDAAALAAVARRAAAGVDRGVAVAEPRPLQAVLDEFLLPQRALSAVLAILAGGAMLLALVGVYGVMSYAVSQRTREIGIRLAVGATPRRVLTLVLGEALLLAAVGSALGLAAAFGLAHLLAGLLVGVSGTDPRVYATLTIGLLAVALLACIVPARRALGVDPVVALRDS